MKRPDGNEYSDVLRILTGYYRSMLASLANEIRENVDAFEVPLIGKAEDLLEKHAWPIQQFSVIYSALKAEGEALFEEKVVRLAEDEYLCFSCRAVITKSAAACPKCGWSWQGRREGRQLPLEQRMTERARRAVDSAGDHARKLGASRVEVQHLLLALAQEKGGMASRVLADIGVDHSSLERRIASGATQAPERGMPRRIGLSEEVEQVLTDAWAECRQQEAEQLGTAHLLLAMTRTLGDTATRLAGLLEMDLAAFRQLVVSQLETDAAE